jgi:hypothetical protein
MCSDVQATQRTGIVMTLDLMSDVLAGNIVCSRSWFSDWLGLNRIVHFNYLLLLVTRANQTLHAEPASIVAFA